MTQTKLIKELEEMENKIKSGFEGKIIDIEETNSDTFFEDSGTYENKEGIGVTVEIIGENDTSFEQFFARPSPLGIQKSNIFLFKKKYGKYPEVGLTVKVEINEDGFFKIDLD